MVFVAMNGAKQVMTQQAINNNNLANINTTGFRADMSVSVAAETTADSPETRLFSINKSMGVSSRPGDVYTTGRALDVAINDNGYIAVQDEEGGEAYTRNGEMVIGPGGLLQTAGGYSVLGEGGPIAIPPHEQLEIGKDGTISIKAPGQNALIQLDRIKLVSLEDGTVSKTDNGLLKSSAEAVVDGQVTVTGGALESSNVNSVEALVNMISLARQYEIQIKLMKAAEENETASTQMLTMR